MAYTELPPPRAREPFVACVWRSSPGPPGPVLPDGCVDVVWTGLSLVVAGPPTQVAHPVTAPEATKLGGRFRGRGAGATQARGAPPGGPRRRRARRACRRARRRRTAARRSVARPARA